jgi:hypothetical protein
MRGRKLCHARLSDRQDAADEFAYFSGEDDDEKDMFTSAGAWLGDDKFKLSLQFVSGRLTSRKKGRRKTQ